jgi:hypothetical protein
MYGSNTGEWSAYACTVCRAQFDYYGADHTDVAPFWVHAGWCEVAVMTRMLEEQKKEAKLPGALPALEAKSSGAGG